MLTIKRMILSGVTGFDDPLFESCATRCTPIHHPKLMGNKLAKNLFASVKSPYFGMQDFAFAHVSASA